MKKPDLTKYKTTSTLYLLILIIAAVALVFGWQLYLIQSQQPQHGSAHPDAPVPAC